MHTTTKDQQIAAVATVNNESYICHTTGQQ